MAEMILLLQVVSTLAMVGLIWFVQVVHYPLFGQVGGQHFQSYEKSHQQRTTYVVAPLMLAEAVTALLLLWLRPSAVSAGIPLAGLLLVGLLWGSTFFWQVPAHERLSKSFDPVTHRRLVQSNWFRTAGWSLRGVLVCWMCLQIFSAAATAGEPVAIHP